MKDYTVIPLSELPIRVSKYYTRPGDKKSLYPCLVKVISLPTQYFDPISVARETNDIYALIEKSIPRIKILARQKLTKVSHAPQPSLMNLRSSSRYGSNRNLQTTKTVSMSVEKCKGWFEILSEDEKAAPGISTVSDLASKFPDSCLVRKEIWAYNTDESAGSCSNWRIIRGGELLGLIAVENLPTMTTILTQAKAPGLPYGLTGLTHLSTYYGHAANFNDQYLRCIDYTGTTWYLSLGSRGYFSPVAKRENISGVHSLKDIAHKFYLPLKVKLVNYHCGQDLKMGNKLLSTIPEGSILRLLSATREYDFDVYILSSEGIKKLRLPYACARKMFVQYPTELQFPTAYSQDPSAFDVNPTIKICMSLLKKMSMNNDEKITPIPPNIQIAEPVYNVPTIGEALYGSSFLQNNKPIYANHSIEVPNSRAYRPGNQTNPGYSAPNALKKSPEYGVKYSLLVKERYLNKPDPGVQKYNLSPYAPIQNKRETVKGTPLSSLPRRCSPNIIYYSTSLSDHLETNNNEKGYSLRTVKSDQTHLNTSTLRVKKEYQSATKNRTDVHPPNPDKKDCLKLNSDDLALRLQSLISELVTKDNNNINNKVPSVQLKNNGAKNLKIYQKQEGLYAGSRKPKINFDNSIPDNPCKEEAKYQLVALKKPKPNYELPKKSTTIVHKLKLWILGYVKDMECYDNALYFNVEDKPAPFEHHSYHINRCINY